MLNPRWEWVNAATEAFISEALEELERRGSGDSAVRGWEEELKAAGQACMKRSTKPRQGLEARRKAGVSSRGSPSPAARHVSDCALAKLRQIGSESFQLAGWGLNLPAAELPFPANPRAVSRGSVTPEAAVKSVFARPCVSEFGTSTAECPHGVSRWKIFFILCLDELTL